MQREFNNKEGGWKKRKSGNGVAHISSLFSKYTKILKAPQGTVVKAFLDVMSQKYGVTLKKEQCLYSVRSKTLTLHIPGPLKSEILLQKGKILEEIARIIGEENTPKNIL